MQASLNNCLIGKALYACEPITGLAIFDPVTTVMMRPTPDERRILLRFVQPGLVGLIDGTLSTLAPIFSAAFISGPRAALLVGLATSLGAGISMGLSEALSDDGSRTDRGSSATRGLVTGLMTAVGGTLHSLPFLIGSLRPAIALAVLVAALELIGIALVRKRFLAMSMKSSFVQVILGGALIIGVGFLIGNA